jgi:hypothetical protein
MKIFISSSILQFKTRFIPSECIILPMLSFIPSGVNETIAKLKNLKPSEIICENDSILREILPYFEDIPIYVMKYSNGIEYCGSPIKHKMNYAVISAYFTLFTYGLILDNFILSIFLGIINLSIFITVILWYSDKEEWEAWSKKIIYT